ncbi:MAG: heme biosynthesis protein HemY [Brachymonas sp.]
MRVALWLLAIFAAAVGVALFAARSTGSVTLYWPPHRVDLSLNLVLLLLAALFVLLHLAIRALGALADLPSQAKAWRAAQRQQAMHGELRDALAHLLAGRFSRAKKQALLAHQHAKALELEPSLRSACLKVQSQSLLIAAEAAQSMQEASDRERYVQAALQVPLPKSAAHFKEGATLRSARWMLDEHDPSTSLTRLSTLSQGAQRRTLALRLKLRALQLAKQPALALETARMLAKHGGFSDGAAQSILRSLAISTLSQAHDADQLLQAWETLSHEDRSQPQVATHAALRLVNFSAGLPEATELLERARAWIEPVWQRYPQLPESEQVRVVRALEASFSPQTASLDHAWLAKIETAQRQLPHDARLQYLAGMACLRRQLWGKSQQMLSSSAAHLGDAQLRRSAYQSLAQLAEQRGDEAAAVAAWKKAS